ncbi:MAG: hypothetical protein J7M20_06245 [Deltaproteobacteria bacterium]|nr:hypothetical protein [Deltaproteobacteria bacterium]
MRTFSLMPLVNPGPEHHLVNLSIAGFNLRIKAVCPAVHAHMVGVKPPTATQQGQAQVIR